MSKHLDELDYELLDYLQNDGRLTNVALSERVALSAPGVLKRIRKLENESVIDKYVAIINRETVGYDMLCFVQVTLQRHEPDAVSDFPTSIMNMPEIMECYFLTGEYDYLLKIIVRNRKHLEQFLVEKLTPIPGMDKIRTSLVLSEIKSTTAIPLPKK